MTTGADIQAQEWEALYDELAATLEKHGTQNAFGDGDFWIVSDNYESPQHKVCVTKIAFLTRPIAAEVQRLLRKYSLGWEVLFSLDGEGLRPTEDDWGILVRKTDIQEHWSIERMQKAFGSDFRWRPSIAAT